MDAHCRAVSGAAGVCLALRYLAFLTCAATPPGALGDNMQWACATPWEEPLPTNAVLLTLREAVTAALTSAPDIEIAEARVQAARRAVAMQRSVYWPSLSLNATWGQSRSEDGGVSPGLYSAGLNANWGLFDGFQREFEVLKASRERDVAELTADESRRLLRRAVVRAYFGALLAQERMLAAHGDIAFNKMMLSFVNKRYSNGTASRSDVLNFRIRVTEDVDTYLTQRQLLAVGLAALAALLNADKSLGIDTCRLENPHPEPAGAMAVDLPQEIAHARRTRADIRAQTAEVAAAKAGLGVERGKRLPSIALQGSYTMQREEDPGFDIPEDTGSFVGLTLGWDLFTGGRTRNAIKEAEAALRETRATYRGRLRDLTRELKQYELTLEHAHMRLVNGILACEAATEDRDMVTKLYEAGLVAVTRLNEVQKDVTHSLGRLIEARILFSQTWEEFQIAAGHAYPDTASPRADDEPDAREEAAFTDPAATPGIADSGLQIVEHMEATRPVPIHVTRTERP
jgi:outer membrane protein TolC